MKVKCGCIWTRWNGSCCFFPSSSPGTSSRSFDTVYLYYEVPQFSHNLVYSAGTFTHDPVEKFGVSSFVSAVSRVITFFYLYSMRVFIASMNTLLWNFAFTKWCRQLASCHCAMFTIHAAKFTTAEKNGNIADSYSSTHVCRGHEDKIELNVKFNICSIQLNKLFNTTCSMQLAFGNSLSSIRNKTGVFLTKNSINNEKLAHFAPHWCNICRSDVLWASFKNIISVLTAHSHSSITIKQNQSPSHVSWQGHGFMAVDLWLCLRLIYDSLWQIYIIHKIYDRILWHERNILSGMGWWPSIYSLWQIGIWHRIYDEILWHEKNLRKVAGEVPLLHVLSVMSQLFEVCYKISVAVIRTKQSF